MKTKIYFQSPDQFVDICNDYGVVTVSIAEWKEVDHGIGAYEYFGHKGVHKYIVTEIQDINVEAVNGQDVNPVVADYVKQVLIEKYDFIAEF